MVARAIGLLSYQRASELPRQFVLLANGDFEVSNFAGSVPQVFLATWWIVVCPQMTQMCADGCGGVVADL